ncbi:MAG: hypothetical protein ACE5KZ_11850 [Candidatus Scalinduaceae bacterium]
MIDRPSRNTMAENLRHYVSGRITNDDLADSNIRFEDRGVKAVYDMAWQLYDDLYQHKATGRHRIEGELRDYVARWVCFLHTDLEYQWPKYNFIQIKNLPLNILTLGWWEKRKQKKWDEFETHGDFKYWPFISHQDYQSALENPKLLSKESD